jgi:PIN domain nuclease of toxin-antitoxin system
MRRGLLDNGYSELPISSDHAVAIDTLPPIHKDPFDRLLIAQATVEGITLLTVDPIVSRYPGPIRKV